MARGINFVLGKRRASLILRMHQGAGRVFAQRRRARWSVRPFDVRLIQAVRRSLTSPRQARTWAFRRSYDDRIAAGWFEGIPVRQSRPAAYEANSSSNALASFKSSVSKPSLNHP
jgi:hypothetical protein